MTTNAEVGKDGAKSTPRILSEFSRKMFSTGIVRHLKLNKRYYSRPLSPLRKKQAKMKRLTRREQLNQDIKDGKVLVNQQGRVVKR